MYQTGLLVLQPPTTPVTPAPPTTPKTEEKPSTSKTVTPTVPIDKSTDKAPDPNKVTDKAPEAKPSTEKQAAATETEALPHTGDDTAPYSKPYKPRRISYCSRTWFLAKT